jgi:threonine aldolase
VPELHEISYRSFASDNNAGVHPEVLTALAEANGGHVTGYGDDPYTERLRQLVGDLFGPAAHAYPVLTGTGANVVALAAMTRRFEAVITTSTAHIHVDECGAPERIAGTKLLTVPTSDGKLTPQLLRSAVFGVGDVHHIQARVVALTQSTELGTVYTAEELTELTAAAHELDLAVYVDGARLSNAAASLGLSFAQMITDTGVDVVGLGGTKNGIMAGEVVVVLNPAVVDGTEFHRKASAQLASKMRFVSAQLCALFGSDLYLRSAAHANRMASRLAAAIDGVQGVRIRHEVQANAVFVVLADGIADILHRTHHFYPWDEAAGEWRWMCAFDTTEDDVDAFAAAVRDAAAHVAAGVAPVR